VGHHEWWDGSGYPGKIDNLYARRIQVLGSKSGEEIPISARIVSLADVFDALISRRAYKEAWADEDVYEHVEAQAGRQFDPLLVDLFMGMKEVVASIRRKYP
jgi:response regulator RpfG family c-di-GMP phosphodiesterase